MRNIQLIILIALFVLFIPCHIHAQSISAQFSIKELNDSLFQYISGKSYKSGCPVKRSDLRLLIVTHYDFSGNVCRGELICNTLIAQDLIDIFSTLFAEHYPIEKIRLIDYYNADDNASMSDNNTSCFNYRTISGSAKISRHGLGMAIDINPRYNPEVKIHNGKTIISPSNGVDYKDRTKPFPHKINHADLCYKLFTQHGFRWGGNWKYSKDYQHFEK